MFPYPPEQCINEGIQSYFENEFTLEKQEIDASEPHDTKPEHLLLDQTEDSEKEESTEETTASGTGSMVKLLFGKIK